VLKDKADSLEQAYKSDIRLNGVICLQALLDRTMFGSDIDSLLVGSGIYLASGFTSP
jgi:hypothetical protein